MSSKSIRLSPLGLSNDSREGRHVLDIAERLLPRGSPTRNTIRADLAKSISRIQALGFCVSEAPDLLSQWRGYADDAQGVALGFDLDQLSAAIRDENAAQSRNLVLQKVAYKNSSLARIMKACLRRISDHDHTLLTMGPIRIGGSYIETPDEKAQYREWK
jgi:hypothetical protein